MTTVGVKPDRSLLPSFASLGGHGKEILWNIPHSHVSLYFVPLLFVSLLCSYHNGSFHFFCFLIWIFPFLISQVSALFPHPCSLCVLSLFFFTLPVLHHSSWLLSCSCIHKQIPFFGSSPGFLSLLSHHLAARHCHLQRAALTVTTAWETGNSKSDCWRSSTYTDFWGFYFGLEISSIFS